MLIRDNVLNAIADEYLAKGGEARLPRFEIYLNMRLFVLKWGIEEIPPSPLCKGGTKPKGDHDGGNDEGED